MTKTDRSRRDFIQFLGKASIGSLLIPPFLESCGNYNNKIISPDLSDAEKERLRALVIQGIDPSRKDDVVLAEGLNYNVLIRWDTPINASEKFGFNNDFTCFLPLDETGDDGLLWVNHEYTNPLFTSNFNYHKRSQKRTKDQVDLERKTVGGSIVRVKKVEDSWEVIYGDSYNRRIDGTTAIPFNWHEKIRGAEYAIGTLSNCSGGITPWGTILTCEENYDDCYGETRYDHNNEAIHDQSMMGWDEFYPLPPEHYGWVVEVDPKSGKAQKHIALGRCAHECATLKKLEDGRIVAYTGDDKNDGFLYKFVSSEPDSLKEGTLYVADTINGKWLPLDIEVQPKLKAKFKTQTEVLIRMREAAAMLGATPQNRPEDIEIDPLTGHVLVAMTNNKPKGDYHGSILKLMEKNGAYDALEFDIDTLAVGGKKAGFSCPDNMVFDLAGNLWFTSDISGSAMNNPLKPYYSFCNNGLFVLLRHGEQSGQILQLASAPKDAEFTGPWFSPDYRTLFLSVQHPGESSKSKERPSSCWPHDADGLPKPSVITIQGQLLDKLNGLNKLD